MCAMTFMTECDGASEILKSDKLGLAQVPPERREAIHDEITPAAWAKSKLGRSSYERRSA